VFDVLGEEQEKWSIGNMINKIAGLRIFEITLFADKLPVG
jgi:hypothetical protein